MNCSAWSTTHVLRLLKSPVSRFKQPVSYNCSKIVLAGILFQKVVTGHVVCAFTDFIEANSTFFLEPKKSGPFLSGTVVSGRSVVGGRTSSVDIAAEAGPARPGVTQPNLWSPGAEPGGARLLALSARTLRSHVSAAAPACRPEPCERDSSDIRPREGKNRLLTLALVAKVVKQAALESHGSELVIQSVPKSD